MRQPCQPLAQQPINLALVEPIADSLQRLGVFAPEDAVVQRLEGDAALAQLALGVLVAVDTQLGVVRKVGTELQEERAEVVVHAVEVVVVDHRAAIDHPRIAHAGACTTTPLGAHHARLLLGAAGYRIPSSASNRCRYCWVMSSLRWCLPKLTRSTPCSAINFSMLATNATVLGATVAVEAKR